MAKCPDCEVGELEEVKTKNKMTLLRCKRCTFWGRKSNGKLRAVEQPVEQSGGVERPDDNGSGKPRSSKRKAKAKVQTAKEVPQIETPKQVVEPKRGGFSLFKL